MAHKKAAGSTSNNRESQAKRLGVKKFGGQRVISGNIIVRQRGTKFYPGIGVELGKDHTLYSVVEGVVQFKSRKERDFTGHLGKRTYVSVVKAPKKAKLEKAAKEAKVAK